MQVGPGLNVLGDAALRAATGWQSAVEQVARSGMLGTGASVQVTGIVGGAEALAGVEHAAADVHAVAAQLHPVLPDQLADRVGRVDVFVDGVRSIVAPGGKPRTAEQLATLRSGLRFDSIGEPAAVTGALVGVARLVDAHGGVDAVAKAGGIAAIDDAAHAIGAGMVEPAGHAAKRASSALREYADAASALHVGGDRVARASAARADGILLGDIATRSFDTIGSDTYAGGVGAPARDLMRDVTTETAKLPDLQQGIHLRGTSSAKSEALQLARTFDNAGDQLATEVARAADLGSVAWTNRDVRNAAEQLTAFLDQPAARFAAPTDAATTVARLGDLGTISAALSRTFTTSVDRSLGTWTEWVGAQDRAVATGGQLVIDLETALRADPALRRRIPEPVVDGIYAVADHVTSAQTEANATQALRRDLAALGRSLDLVQPDLPITAKTHPVRFAAAEGRRLAADAAGFTAGIDAFKAATTPATKRIAAADMLRDTVELGNHLAAVQSSVPSHATAVRDEARIAVARRAEKDLVPTIKERYATLWNDPATKELLTNYQGQERWTGLRADAEGVVTPLSDWSPRPQLLDPIFQPIERDAVRLRQQIADLEAWHATGQLPEGFDAARNPELAGVAALHELAKASPAAGAPVADARAEAAQAAAELLRLHDADQQATSLRLLPEGYAQLLDTAREQVAPAWDARVQHLERLVASRPHELPEQLLDRVERAREAVVMDALPDRATALATSSPRFSGLRTQLEHAAKTADQPPLAADVIAALAEGKRLVANPPTDASQRQVLGHAFATAEAATTLVADGATRWRTRQAVPMLDAIVADIDAAMLPEWRARSHWNGGVMQAKVDVASVAEALRNPDRYGSVLVGSALESQTKRLARARTNLELAHVGVYDARGGLPTGAGAAELAEHDTMHNWPSDRQLRRSRERLADAMKTLDKGDAWYNPTHRTRQWMRAMQKVDAELARVSPVVPDDIGSQIHQNMLTGLAELDTSRRAVKIAYLKEGAYPKRALAGKAKSDARSLDVMIEMAQQMGKPEPIVTDLSAGTTSGTIDATTSANYLPDVI